MARRRPSEIVSKNHSLLISVASMFAKYRVRTDEGGDEDDTALISIYDREDVMLKPFEGQEKLIKVVK